MASENLNLLLEALVDNTGEINDTGSLVRSSGAVIVPGLRYAINIGDLQIVPGIAFPIQFANSESRTGVFLYLSFEHPF